MNAKQSRSFADLPGKTECAGCMGCVDACPRNALQSVLKKDGHYYVQGDSARCVQCGICTNVCPVLNFHRFPPAALEDCRAAWSNTPSVRQKSASGGVFAEIARSFLKRRGVVWGVAMIGMHPQHVAVEDPEELEKLQGSKYLQEDPSGTYRKVLAQLAEKRPVLFSGLPCQCAALLSLAQKARLDGELYTIDLICGGASSLRPLNSFAKRHPEIQSIRSFRDKENGWKPQGYRYSLKTLRRDGGIANEGAENPILMGFGNPYLQRPSCNRCRFASRQRRMTDLTIGDFWGIQDFPEEHFNGISCVVCHSERGRRFLEQADLSLHAASVETMLKHNQRYACGQRAVRRAGWKRQMTYLLFHYMERSSSRTLLYKVLRFLAA